MAACIGIVVWVFLSAFSCKTNVKHWVFFGGGGSIVLRFTQGVVASASLLCICLRFLIITL